MPIDFAQTLTALNGATITDRQPDGVDDKGRPKVKDVPMTLGIVAVMGLVNEREGEDLTGMQKFENYALAQRIYGATGALDLSAEQVVVVKERIGQMFSPAVIGSAWPMLDPTLGES